MIHCHSYSMSRNDTTTLDKFKMSSKPVWVDIINPSEKEIKDVAKKFNLSEKDLDNSLDKFERARIEERGNYSLIFLKIPRKKGSIYSTGTLGLFVGKNFVVSVYGGKSDKFQEFKKKVDPQLISKQGIPKLTHMLISQVVSHFYHALNDIGGDLDRIEDKFLANKNVDVHPLFAKKKTLLYFRNALMTNREVIKALSSGLCKNLKRANEFTELYSEILQLVDTEEVLRGRITEAANLYMSSVSNNMNEVMKSFTVIASLLLIPMLITGAYGMNFVNIPLGQHQWGFWVTIGIIITSMVAAYLAFKAKKWA